MEDWIVNLIVGLVSAIFGFFGGFAVKSHFIKVKQNINGSNNKQTIEGVDNGEQDKTEN